MRWSALSPFVLAMPFLAGCPEENPTSTADAGPAAAPKPTASATAAPQASASAAPAEPKGLCTTVTEKVWANAANRVTGLTTKRMKDNRIAVGLAVGGVPHVLAVAQNGEGILVKARTGGGTIFSKGLKADEGSRTVLRVTPYEVEGETAKAYVDFKDELKDKSKHVVCGPSDTTEGWIKFDGTPLLDRDPKPTGDDRAAIFKDTGDVGYRELKDCRTFIDIKKGETYIIGSELRAKDAGEGKTTYKAALVLATGPKKEITLREIELKDDPPKEVVFDMPVTHGVKDGSYLLMSRFGGSLVAGFLNANKTLQSKFVTWQGFPTRPEANRDDEGMTMMVTSVSTGKDFELRGVRIGPKNELPKAMVKIETGDPDEKTATDPMFLRDFKDRRWLAYTAGPRGKGRLKIVPIDENFKPLGKPHALTGENEGAAEPRVVPLEDGNIFIAYIRDTGTGVGELFSEIVKCDDPPK